MAASEQQEQQQVQQQEEQQQVQPQQPQSQAQGKQLTPDDLGIILQAAVAAGIDPSQLKTKNPFEADASPTSVALRSAISKLDPAAAERLSDMAGTEMTLACSAFLQGVGELTPAVRKELAIVKPAKLAEIKSAELAEQVKRFEEGQAERAKIHAGHQASLDSQLQDALLQSRRRAFGAKPNQGRG